VRIAAGEGAVLGWFESASLLRLLRLQLLSLLLAGEWTPASHGWINEEKDKTSYEQNKVSSWSKYFDKYDQE
jgi:hypothetical protein